MTGYGKNDISWTIVFENKLFTYLLLPFSLLYYCVIETRNLLYDAGLIKSVSFNIPIISVGNLSIGGAGKTPHVEYLVSFLDSHLHIGCLSRGYRRKSKGFRVVRVDNSFDEVGDEALQLKRKYSNLEVFVSESRVLGVIELLKVRPNLNLILLDDAFQHRSIRPGLNILLTEFSNPYSKDFVLPSGRLRESRKSSSRADIVIITKCPVGEQRIDKQLWREQLGLLDNQLLYFSRYVYGQLYSFYDGNYLTKQLGNTIIFLSAIADTQYLKQELNTYTNTIIHLEYEDHHKFTNRDIERVIELYETHRSDNPCIITTEKDAMRLSIYYYKLKDLNIPIYVLPIRVEFLNEEAHKFQQEIRDFLLNFKV